MQTKKRTKTTNVALSIAFSISLFFFYGCHSDERCATLLNTKCTSCHGLQSTCEQIGANKKKWLHTIDAMIDLNAKISEDEKKTLANCLSKPAEKKRSYCR